MAIVTTDDKHYKAIADAIRSYDGDETLKLRPEDMADMVIFIKDVSFMDGERKGSEAGYELGYGFGKSDGIEQGKQAEYDRFWDGYQRNGTRTDYFNAFRYWQFTSFRPKYSIRTTNASNMFAFSDMPFSLIEELEQAGVEMDTSAATDIAGVFWGANFTETPEIKAVKCKNINNVYYGCTKLKKTTLTIEADVTQANATFGSCAELEDLTINGTIPCDIDFASCIKLTNASVQSIIDALADLTGATAKTIKFHATVGAKLTDAQKATITAKNWTLVY